MSGRMTQLAAFRALKKNRDASKKFSVVSLTKNGEPSKMAVSDICKANTLEQAEVIKARLEGLNPSRSFVIVAS